MRVLIADDDPIAAALLSHTLRRWNIDSVTAPDGDAAWGLLAADSPPSLAIVDWTMPNVDGLELCRRIRQDEAHAHMYVILLTSRDRPADLVGGLDAGADDYLVKPFNTEELRARVNVGLRVLGLQARLAEQVRELRDALSKVKQLRGLLPICSYCKRIRSDENYWEQVERYISNHADVEFTHGICPPCLKTAMAELGQRSK